MDYEEKKMGKFSLATYKSENKTAVIVYFDGYHCDEFDCAVTGVLYKHGLLVKPVSSEENCDNRTYCFFNNNGDEVFRTKRKMSEDKTKFEEIIQIYEDCDSVSYKKTRTDGDVVRKTFNIATNQEVVEGQLSLF